MTTETRAVITTIRHHATGEIVTLRDTGSVLDASLDSLPQWVYDQTSTGGQEELDRVLNIYESLLDDYVAAGYAPDCDGVVVAHAPHDWRDAAMPSRCEEKIMRRLRVDRVADGEYDVDYPTVSNEDGILLASRERVLVRGGRADRVWSGWSSLEWCDRQQRHVRRGLVVWAESDGKKKSYECYTSLADALLAATAHGTLEIIRWEWLDAEDGLCVAYTLDTLGRRRPYPSRD